MLINIVKEIIIYWRKIIYFNILISLLIGLNFYTFLLPRRYQSEAKIYIPKQDIGLHYAPRFSDVDNPTGGKIFKLKRKKPILPEMLIAIARSRSVLEKVVKECNLFDYFKIKNRNMEEAVKSLRKSVKISFSSEGIITIRIRTTNALLSAQIINALIKETDLFLKTAQLFSLQRVSNYLEQTINDLGYSISTTEDSLKNFCIQNGIIDSLTVNNFIKQYYALQFNAIDKKLKSHQLASYLTSENPLYIITKYETSALNKEIKKLEDDPSQVFSYKKLPDLINNYNHLDYQIKNLSSIYTYLVTTYEICKVHTKNNLFIINILDSAKPVTQPDEPNLIKLICILLLISTTGTLLSMGTALAIKNFFPKIDEQNWRTKLFWFIFMFNLIISLSYLIHPFFPLPGLLLVLIFIFIIIFMTFIIIPFFILISILFIIILQPASGIKIYALLCAIFLFLRILTRLLKGETEVSFTKFDLTIFLYVISCLPGIIFVSDIGNYLRGFFSILLSLTLYILTRDLLNTHKKVKIMLQTFSLLGLFLSFLMLRSFFSSGFNIFEAALLRRVTDIPLGSTNYLAAFLNLFLPIGLSLFLTHNNKFLKILNLITLIAICFSLILTMSRGGFICLIVSVITFSLLISRNKIITLGTICIIVLGFLLFNPLVKIYLLRFQSAAGELAILGRFNMWNDALRFFLKYPLTGVGLNNALTYDVPGIGIGDPNPHNFLLKTASESGIFALLLIIAIYSQIGSVVKKIWGKTKNARGVKYISAGFITSFVVAIINQLFEPTLEGWAYKAIFWVLIGILYKFCFFVEKNNVSLFTET